MHERARVALRPATPEDRDLLYRVYASTRSDEFAALDWDEGTVAALLRSQFEIQDRAYREKYPAASFSIVVVDDVSAGRMYVADRPEAIRLIDIELLSDYRGRGIGTRLIRELQDRARSGGRTLRLSVARTNRAHALYRRLGFREVAGNDAYVELEWRADQAKTA
jgi:ribosomal protein S18 acetylase RimI-like enzyme